MKYAVKKDGKYLSSLFPAKFEGTKPEYYWYTNKQIAEDIAQQLNAEVETMDYQDKIGIVLRSLLDGELALASSEILTNYKVRNEFIDRIEARLAENDWISLSDATTFSKSFVPKGRN